MAAVDEAEAQGIVETAMRGRARLHSGRSRRSALVTLAVLGGTGLLLAVLAAGGGPDAAPTCDGRTMTRGDVCVVDPDSGGGTYTYRQMIDRRESRHVVWSVLGYGLAGLCVVLMIPVAKWLDPATPWGARTTARCPRCGGTTLREKTTTRSTSRGRTAHHYTAVVTLCTPACGFAALRRP